MNLSRGISSSFEALANAAELLPWMRAETLPVQAPRHQAHTGGLPDIPDIPGAVGFPVGRRGSSPAQQSW